MREPWPEDVRRTLEVCRRDPACDVLSSRGWAGLREHCGELAVELDALGRRTIAQRVDRDYARLHAQLREATAAGWAGNRLLLADAVEELASTLAAIQRFQAVLMAARVSSPAGDAGALQDFGNEPERGPEAGKPSRTLTVATLLEWTNLSHTALNKYAQLAGVQTPRRGQRNFRYGWTDARRILETVIANASDRRIRDKCRAALENPPEITQ
jgi:hypothetical protein